MGMNVDVQMKHDEGEMDVDVEANKEIHETNKENKYQSKKNSVLGKRAFFNAFDDFTQNNHSVIGMPVFKKARF